MAPTETTLTIANRRVRYWQAGAAENYPILLIHGGVGDGRLHWHAALPLLADDYFVLAFDLPGFGGSDPIDGGLEAHVEWIHAFLDEMHLEAAALVGNSFGGLLVRAFASRYPARVPAAIIINGGILPNITPFFAQLARLPVIGPALFNFIGGAACSRGSINRMIYVKRVASEAFVREVATYAKSFGRTLRLTAAHPIPQNLTPPVPTLVLWGIEDQLAPLDEAQHLQKTIPGAKLVQIADCGHMPQLEEPEVFATQVKDFLYQIRNPRASKLPGAGRLS
ncbi:MAG: alpha/beta hydrolase [Chloroflexi bacterium]|nr:alpha/beta hydrolase [Chloroflexota bacterium]